MAATAQKTSVLSTLNGLRGLAAICVVLFHRKQWLGPSYPFQDAFLAVDFFFILSGFVVSRAYESKLNVSMTFWNFASRRLQRLYPLIALGVALGALIAFGKLHATNEQIPKLFGLTVAASFLTLPTVWEITSWPLDAPMWSLFLEICVNVAFALAALRLKRWRLTIAVIVLGLIFLACSSNIYGTRPDATAHFAWGFPRVAFLFYLGVLIEKIHAQGVWSKIKIGLLWGSLLLLLSFAIRDDGTFGLTLRLASVMLLYPLIIIGGANIEPKGITMQWARFSGDLSYPLYILHIPLLGVASAISIITGRAQEPSDAAEIAARFIFVIALSWIALKVYDEPLRKLLAQWTTRQISSNGRPIDLSDTRPPTFPALAKEQ